MSRPRSTDPSVPISIAVPTSLKRRLEQELAYTSSRSYWVCEAIKAKLAYNKKQKELEKQFDYTTISSNQLLGMLHARNIIQDDSFRLLMTRVEEIEAAR